MLQELMFSNYSCGMLHEMFICRKDEKYGVLMWHDFQFRCECMPSQTIHKGNLFRIVRRRFNSRKLLLSGILNAPQRDSYIAQSQHAVTCHGQLCVSLCKHCKLCCWRQALDRSGHYQSLLIKLYTYESTCTCMNGALSSELNGPV